MQSKLEELWLEIRQDLFNRSDNLAEHFEFLDQQPKIFPGLASKQGFVGVGLARLRDSCSQSRTFCV